MERISGIDGNVLNQLHTPCYIIEEELLRNNLRLIKHVSQEASVEIILALKAFALWKTFPILREYISGTTASSINEARLTFHEFGVRPHTYSPAYTEQDFPEIVKKSSHITFNSWSQFKRFYPLAKGRVSCGIRINPMYSEIETELYNPCAIGSRFGIKSTDMPDRLPEGVEGFHCHNHCESDSYALERSLQHIEDGFGRWLDNLKWINLGGGHLMTRKDYDVDHLIETLKNFKSAHNNLRIILEPGSAFAWQTGPLIASVVDIVENGGIKTAILNVSFSCHMPDCLEMPYQPEVRGAVQTSDSQGDFIYRLGGNSCLSGDWMGNWDFNHKLKIGDKLIFEDMIHYTTVKTNMFNGVSHPSILMLHSDHSLEILKEYRYEDYRDRMC